MVNKYGAITTVQRSYLTISDEFKPLVYNYELVNGFEAQLAFLNQFTFTAIDGGYSIKVADGVELQGEVVIPPIYNNQDVVKIDSNAFVDQRKITTVVIPTTVIQIGSGVFAGCNRLESITLPFLGANISSNGTFSYLFGSAAIPQSLKKVTVTVQDRVVDSAFANCNYIEQIFYEKEIEYIGANSFNGCEALRSFNSSEEGTINLSGAMDKIGNSAFKNCEAIIHIIFSDEIMIIDNYAFSGCKNIEEVNLTNRITTIGDYAFQELKKLKLITVPNNVTVIGMGAFYGCNAVEKITIPFIGRSKDALGEEQVFGYVFGYYKIAPDFTGGVGTGYDPVAFVNQQIEMPKNGTIWQYSCYNGQKYFSARLLCSCYYYIPSSIRMVVVTNQTEVKTAAFKGCTMLEDITFTKGLESQGDYAFQNCAATIHDGTE